MTRRGTTNRNARGNSRDRRIRRTWLLVEFGDGVKAPCSFCGIMLTFETITADRHPIPGIQGGTYRRGNIRPSCGTCNSADGGRLGNERRKNMTETPVVKVGQVWQDCDKRSYGRRVRVVRVEDPYVYVEAVATGRKARLMLRRMRPTSTGFRLVEDV